MLELDPRRLIQTHFGCRPDDLARTVVLSTHWPLESFAKLWDDEPEEHNGWFAAVTGRYGGRELTVVLTHNGACRVGQAMLTLITGGAERFLLIGRSSGLYDEMRLGDVAVVRTSICGEGYSRYHGADHFLDDPFGWRVTIDESLVLQLEARLKERTGELDVDVHSVRTFSADSMLAQDRELGEYVRIKGGHIIDGETSAAFATARIHQVLAASLQCVIALPLADKPLFGAFGGEDSRRIEKTHLKMSTLALDAATVLDAYEPD
jgi:uridine phosphorylase